MKKTTKTFAIFMSTILMMTPFSTKHAFAASYPIGGAYSIGGEFHNGADVISACDYWGLCGYDSYYSINPTFSYLNSNRLNAYVLYFSAHGNQDAIYLPNSLKLSDGRIAADSNTVEISNFQLDRPKLYVYDACLTASNGNGSGINLCTKTINAGVDCVIGWTESIGVQDAYDWEKRFQNQLALGWSVINAANYANGFSYYDNTTIKSWRIYGNSNMVVKSSAKSNNVSKSEYVEKDSFEYINCSNATYSTFYQEEQNLDSVLKSEFKDFNPLEYDVTFTYTNDEKTDYVADYTFKLGEYDTKSGYSVIVNEDKVICIQANNMDMVANNDLMRVATPQVTDDIIETAYNKADKEVADRHDNSQITEQYGELFYNSIESKYYYMVKTTYQTEEGGYGSFFTFEEIF